MPPASLSCWKTAAVARGASEKSTTPVTVETAPIWMGPFSQVGAAAAEGHEQGQITVRAQRLHRELLQIAVKRAFLAIDQRQEQLATSVSRARSGHLPARRDEPLLAVQREVRLLLGGVPIAHRIERQERPRDAGRSAEAGHGRDRVHLVVERARAVRHHVVLVAAVGQRHAVGAQLEQVHDRAAEQLRVLALCPGLHAGLVFGQPQRELHLGVPAAAQGRLQPAQLHERKALGQRKVLLQQPVALEGACRSGQQRLGVVKAQAAHALGAQRAQQLSARRAHVNAQHRAVAQLEQLPAHRVARRDEQRQTVQLQLREGAAIQRAQPQVQAAAHVAPGS